MSARPVHYELFARRRADGGWTLEQAGEDRAKLLAAAESLLGEGRALAVKVTKETLDPATGEYRSVPILTRGQVEPEQKKTTREEIAPLCVAPPDLYTAHARDRIARLLEGWLKRQGVTVFELLHRPDLAEALDASHSDLQHAVQKVAVPEAQTRGQTTHEMMRAFQDLADRTITRLRKDGQKNRLSRFEPAGFGQAVLALGGDGERAYRLGGGVAAVLAPARTWPAKIERLLDLADNAPAEGEPRQFALSLLEQPLAEMLSRKEPLAQLLGEELDLGAQLAAATRLAAGRWLNAVCAADSRLAARMPELHGAAARLAAWMDAGAFESVRTALSQRVLRELKGPRRLRPSDPEGEIEILRALALALTASAGRLLPLEDVREAFDERSRMLVGADFVAAVLEGAGSAREEAERLLHLAENVAGAGNKRKVARYLVGVVGAMRFETELRQGADGPAARLATLATLARRAAHCGLPETDQGEILARLGDVAGQIEADARLIAQIAKAPAPVHQRLTLLMRLAAGEAAPAGPVADRAKAELMRLLRAPEHRAALAQAGPQMAALRSLVGAAA